MIGRHRSDNPTRWFRLLLVSSSSAILVPTQLESAHSAAASPPALAHKPVATDDGPHPRAELGAIAARWERRRSRRPCHSRATSSGHERYPADNHGQSARVDELGARS
jgi:hypothetical protein